MEILTAGNRVEADQAAPGEDECPRTAGDCRERGARVTGQLVAEAVADNARPLVEGHNAGAVSPNAVELPRGNLTAGGGRAADGGDQQVSRDNRRAPDAEEVRYHAEGGGCVHLPDHGAVGNREAVQHPLGPDDVDAVIVDNGAAAGAAVVAVEILVVGLVLELPDRCARLGLQAFQAIPIAVAGELEQPPPADRGHRVARTERVLPEHLRPAEAFGGEESRLVARAVTGGSEKPGPVAPLLSLPEVGHVGRRGRRQASE